MMRRRATSRLQRVVMGLLVLVLGARPLVAGERYDEQMSRSYTLEAAGEPARAAAVLDELLDKYSQDFQLFLRAGWLHFKARNYRMALARYERALDLNGDSLDARLGRGWCRYYLADGEGAGADFTVVLAGRPDDASARQGLALLAPPTRLGATLSGMALGYDYHPYQDAAAGISVRGSALFRGRWGVGARYQFSRFESRSRTGGPGRWSSTAFEQHESYATLQYGAPGWGLSLHYGYVANDAGVDEETHVAGFIGRLSPWGDITLAASGSFYEDVTAWQGTLRYRLPVASWLDVTPGAQLQLVDGDLYSSGSLGLTFRRAPFTFALGGRMGTEARPVELALETTYNTPAELLWGGWSSLSIGLGEHWTAGLAYEYRRFELETDTASALGNMHIGWLSLSWTTTVK